MWGAFASWAKTWRFHGEKWWTSWDLTTGNGDFLQIHSLVVQHNYGTCPICRWCSCYFWIYSTHRGFPEHLLNCHRLLQIFPSNHPQSYTFLPWIQAFCGFSAGAAKLGLKVLTRALNYTTLHYITLHYTPLHYTPLHYTSLHDTAPHYTIVHYATLHYTSCSTLHYNTFQHTTFHFTLLHYTTLHYT